jgi:hypothetical protein
MTPGPNLSLRIPPFTKSELKAVIGALEDAGDSCRNSDLVAVLIGRVAAQVKTPRELQKLGADIRAYRVRAKPLGY